MALKFLHDMRQGVLDALSFCQLRQKSLLCIHSRAMQVTWQGALFRALQENEVGVHDTADLGLNLLMLPSRPH